MDCVVIIMRPGILKTVVLSLVILLVNPAFAQNGTSLNNPYVRNPVGSATVPATTYSSGLVASPNPIDRSNNLVITGNIGGGKHFRGFVPYNVETDFGGELGTGTIDDFLRRSTIGQNYYSGGTIPYYSDTGTVTRVLPGTNMILMPPSPKIRTQQVESLGTGPATYGLEQDEYPDSIIELTGSNRSRFFPLGTEKLEQYKYLSEKEQAEKEKEDQKYQQEYGEFTEQLKGLSRKTEELKQRLDMKDEPEELSTESETQISLNRERLLINKPPEPLEPEKPAEPEQPLTPQKQFQKQQEDIYERMLAEYEQSLEAEEMVSPESEEPAEPNENKPQFNMTGRKLEYKPIKASPTPKSSAKPQPKEAKPMTDIEIEARARLVLSERQTFAAYSQDKFNTYMRAAEKFMQEGKYYKAADSYSLASIYKPMDPLSYAGRSHALFAAGEYLSSALYLSRAIDIFNGYVDFKIDIVSMIGDMDTVERRISDIKVWIELNNAAELQFLLAYIYMQLGRLGQASEAINAAYEQMSEVPAVGVLKSAIERQLNQ